MKELLTVWAIELEIGVLFVLPMRTGKRVQIAATSEAEAKRLMDAARELLRDARR